MITVRQINDIARQREEEQEEARRQTAAIIKEAKERAYKEAAEQATDTEGGAPWATTPPAQEVKEPPKEKPAIIPYTIIKCITSLDNIYETRLFGWVLAKAQSVLKLYNKDLSEINLQHALGLTRVTLPARLLLNQGDKNYGNITKSFGLAEKKIVYEKESHVFHLNIIAFPELRKDGRNSIVTFVIHNEIWHALLDFSRGHRTFSLPAYIRLNTKYAVIMYLLVSMQTRPTSYAIGYLKHTLGVEGKSSYERGSNFVSRVLDPAREELLAKAPYYFDYSCTTSGREHKITEIIIIPQPNTVKFDADPTISSQVATLRLRLDDDIRKYIQETFKLGTQPLERLEPLILKIGDKDAIMSKIAAIKEQIILRRVKNRGGYFTRSIQNIFKQTDQNENSLLPNGQR